MESFKENLQSRLVGKCGYNTVQGGALIRREMNAVHALNFVLGKSDVNLSSSIEPNHKVMFTIICILETVTEYDREKLKSCLEEGRNRGLVLEIVLVNLSNNTYDVIGGKFLSDRSMTKVLKETLSERAAGKTQTPPPQRARFFRNPTFKKGPWYKEPAMVLILINAVIFVFGYYSQMKNGINTLHQFGIMSPSLIRSGEYWRLFTCMFLHADIMHLFGNMYFLYILSVYLRPAYSKLKFCLVYFISGLAGSSLSFLFSNANSLGASGAIMGLGGALVAKMVMERKSGYYGPSPYINVAIMVVFNLFYGLFTTGIDNWGHFGGFIAGFLIELFSSLIINKLRSRKA